MKLVQNLKRMHYDVKIIPDKHSLPEKIYTLFKLNKDLPINQWTIFDAKTQMKFLAYSNNHYSTSGLYFLLFTIQYIRSKGVYTPIIIGTDNWTEFFSWSKRKKKEWNKYLNVLNASIYSYNPNWDIRKNLIERTHRTDDEEFYVPLGDKCTSKEKFKKYAKEMLILLDLLPN